MKEGTLKARAKAYGYTPDSMRTTPVDPLQDAISRDILIAEVRTWSQRIGVADRLREIHIRPMKRKWASISTRGRLTLAEDLLYQPSAFRRQVIVHELVHLKLHHGKHNKLFHALVRAYLTAQTDIPSR